jgi:hypothetical protein
MANQSDSDTRSSGLSIPLDSTKIAHDKKIIGLNWQTNVEKGNFRAHPLQKELESAAKFNRFLSVDIMMASHNST